MVHNHIRYRTDSALQTYKEINGANYIECSALSGENIDEVFHTAARVVLAGRKPPEPKVPCAKIKNLCTII